MSQEPVQGTGADSAPQLSAPQDEERRPRRRADNTGDEGHSQDKTETGNKQPVVPPAIRGFRGFLNKILAMQIAPSENELAERKQSASAEAVRQARLVAEENTRNDRGEYKEELVASIRRTNQGLRWAAVTCNVKGGATKSPLTALLAVTHGNTTTRLTTAVDNNPYAGTLAKWLGIDPDATKTVRQTHQQIEAGEVNNFIDFGGALGSNEFSVQLVASDPVSDKESYDRETALSVLQKTIDNSYYVTIDTANSIGSGAVEAALELSDVLILATTTAEDKLGGVKDTVKSFIKWGYGDKVRHAVVVVSCLAPGQTAEDFRHVMGLPDETILLGIPYDLSLAKYQAIKPGNLAEDTAIAALELDYVVSRVADHVRDNGYKGPPLKIRQGQLVPVSSGRTPVLSYVNRPDTTSSQEVGTS